MNNNKLKAKCIRYGYTLRWATTDATSLPQREKDQLAKSPFLKEADDPDDAKVILAPEPADCYQLEGSYVDGGPSYALSVVLKDNLRDRLEHISMFRQLLATFRARESPMLRAKTFKFSADFECEETDAFALQDQFGFSVQLDPRLSSPMFIRMMLFSCDA